MSDQDKLHLIDDFPSKRGLWLAKPSFPLFVLHCSRKHEMFRKSFLILMITYGQMDQEGKLKNLGKSRQVFSLHKYFHLVTSQ